MYLTSVYVVRQIGESKSGIFFIALSAVLLLSGCSRLGLDTYVMREVPKLASSSLTSTKQLSTFYTCQTIVIIFSSLITILLFLLKEYILSIYGIPELKTLLNYMALPIISYSLLLVNIGFIKGFRLPRTALFFSSITIPTVFVFFLFVFKCKDIKYIFLIYSVSILLSFILSSIIIFIKIGDIKLVSLQFDKVFKSLGYFSIFSVSNVVSAWSANLIVGLYLTPDAVSFFHLSNRISVFISFIAVAVNTISSPTLAICKSYNKRKLSKIFIRNLVTINIFSIPIGMLIILNSHYILGIASVQYLQHIDIFILLIVSQLLFLAFGPIGNLLVMQKKEKPVAYISIVGSFLGVVLLFMFVPIIGLYGTVLSGFIVVIFTNASIWLVANKELSLSPISIWRHRG